MYNKILLIIFMLNISPSLCVEEIEQKDIVGNAQVIENFYNVTTIRYSDPIFDFQFEDTYIEEFPFYPVSCLSCISLFLDLNLTLAITQQRR